MQTVAGDRAQARVALTLAALDQHHGGRHQRVVEDGIVGIGHPQAAQRKSSASRAQPPQRVAVAVVEPFRRGDETQGVTGPQLAQGMKHEVRVQPGELRGANAQRGHARRVPGFPLPRDLVVPHIRRVADEQGASAERRHEVAKVIDNDFDPPRQTRLGQALPQQGGHLDATLDSDDARRRPTLGGGDRETASAGAAVDDGVENLVGTKAVEHRIDQPLRRQRDASGAPRQRVVGHAEAFAEPVFACEGRKQVRLGRRDNQLSHRVAFASRRSPPCNQAGRKSRCRPRRCLHRHPQCGGCCRPSRRHRPRAGCPCRWHR